MDAAAAGILRGRVDWRRRRSGMPPRFFTFRIARFLLSERRIFSSDMIDGRGCPPQVCCEAKSIGRFDGRGRCRYFCEDASLAAAGDQQCHLSFLKCLLFSFGTPFFLTTHSMDAATAGLFARPHQLPPKIFLKGTTINLCRLHLSFFRMPSFSFGGHFSFTRMPTFFYRSDKAHNFDASAANQLV